MTSVSAATPSLTAQTLAALYAPGSATDASASTFASALQGAQGAQSSRPSGPPPPPQGASEASGPRPPEDVVQALDAFAAKVADGSATEEDQQALLATVYEAGQRLGGGTLLDQAA